MLSGRYVVQQLETNLRSTENAFKTIYVHLIVVCKSAKAPDMTEMYDNMLPGSSDESFSDSDYHSSDGNSFMEIEDGGSDPSESSSSSSESSSESSSSSSDSSSDTGSSSDSSERSKKHSKKNKKRKRKAKKHKKSKHRKQENLFPQTPFRSLSPIGHNNTMGTPSNMISNTVFQIFKGVPILYVWRHLHQ